MSRPTKKKLLFYEKSEILRLIMKINLECSLCKEPVKKICKHKECYNLEIIKILIDNGADVKLGGGVRGAHDGDLLPGLVWVTVQHEGRLDGGQRLGICLRAALL